MARRRRFWASSRVLGVRCKGEDGGDDELQEEIRPGGVGMRMEGPTSWWKGFEWSGSVTSDWRRLGQSKLTTMLDRVVS